MCLDDFSRDTIAEYNLKANDIVSKDVFRRNSSSLGNQQLCESGHIWTHRDGYAPGQRTIQYDFNLTVGDDIGQRAKTAKAFSSAGMATGALLVILFGNYFGRKKVNVEPYTNSRRPCTIDSHIV